MSTDQYKAKRHSVLELLRSDLARGFIEREVTVRGFKFKLHTLNEDEESWADAYVRMGSPVVMVNSRKAPRLAAAIKSINGVPASELFSYPDTMTKEERKELDENPIQKMYWTRSQMMLFLAEDVNRPFIQELYDQYDKLEAERDEAVKEIPKS